MTMTEERLYKIGEWMVVVIAYVYLMLFGMIGWAFEMGLLLTWLEE